MKLNYKRLGDYIQEIDVRNKDDELLELWGVSVEKKFVKSVANIIGTDLAKYKIVKKNQFVCSLMQVSRDEKIPIALWQNDAEIIVSPAYKVFEIIKTDSLLPEYLNLWFRRTEFDREASYYGVGGVRGSLEWSDFCDMQLPIPDISEQQKIVDAYNVIENRINLKRTINANLEAQALAIYKNNFIDNISKMIPNGWKFGTLAEIYKFQYGKGNTNTDNGGIYPVYGSNGIIGGYNLFNNENAPVIGHIGACGSLIFAYGKHFVTYNGIMCNIINKDYWLFGYYTLLTQNLLAQVRGSTQPFISYDMLYEMPIILPTDEAISAFHNNAVSLFEQIKHNIKEIQRLEVLRNTITGKIATD